MSLRHLAYIIPICQNPKYWFQYHSKSLYQYRWLVRPEPLSVRRLVHIIGIFQNPKYRYQHFFKNQYQCRLLKWLVSVRVWDVWKEENGHIIEGEVTPCQFQIDATINLKGMEKEMAGNTAQWFDIIMEEIRLAHFHNFYNLLTINLRGMEKEVAG